jgi:hypothetical protein
VRTDSVEHQSPGNIVFGRSPRGEGNLPTDCQNPTGFGERTDRIGKVVDAEIGHSAVEAGIRIRQGFGIALHELQVGELGAGDD